MTTGSSTGVAPPARPVPLPRATNGRSWRARDAHRGGDVVARRAGSTPTAARPAVDTRVARVERELERLGARPVGSEGRLEVGEQRVVSSMSRDYDGRRVRSSPDGQATHDNGTATSSDAVRARGMGDVRRSRGRRSHVADRRDVPAVVVAVHLRLRLPGRARPSPRPSWSTGCCSYGAHFTDKADRTTSAKVAEDAHRRRVAVRQGGRKKGIYEKVGERDDERSHRVAAPAWSTDACIFLNRPGFDAGPGCALHLHAMQHRRALQRVQARGLLAAARCAASTTSRTTARVISAPHRVRPRRLG